MVAPPTKVRAGKQDIHRIITLAKEIWLPTFAVYFTDYELNSLFEGMYNQDKLNADLADPNYRLYIVENTEQKDVGYFATIRKQHSLKLDKIYVSPALQGQGIGKWIFENVLNEAKKEFLESIILNVNRRNLPAVRFYEKLGFNIIRSEDIPGLNGFIYDDFVMELHLYHAD